MPVDLGRNLSRIMTNADVLGLNINLLMGTGNATSNNIKLVHCR